MMFELENETKKKQHSRDNSVEKADISKGKKKKKLKVKKEKVDVKSELTKLAQVDNVPLSAAGMSKLFSMAGYAKVGKPEVEIKKKEVEEKAPATPEKSVKEEKKDEK